MNGSPWSNMPVEKNEGVSDRAKMLTEVLAQIREQRQSFPAETTISMPDESTINTGEFLEIQIEDSGNTVNGEEMLKIIQDVVDAANSHLQEYQIEMRIGEEGKDVTISYVNNK